MISGYPSEYACHDHYSTCQKIGDQCVLTPTDKLQDCVNNFSQYMPILQKIEHDKFVSENRGKQCSIVGSYGTACVGAVDAVGKENTDFDTDHNPNDRTFECYFLSTCSIQANKSCGWSSNTEFSKCLKDPGSFLDEYYKKHPTKEFNP